MKTIATLVLAASLPLLAGCGRDDPAPGSADAVRPTTALGRTVARAMEDARRELREGDLSLNHHYDVRIGGARVRQRGDDSLPPASITPQGDLVVAGETVTRTEHERALARAYREALIDVAERGMDLGVRGVDMGMRAASEAIAGLFRGDHEEIEARVEAEARKMEAEAMKLCDRLPRLLEAQQALAAARPEFAPYARMTVHDIEDCRKDIAQDMAEQAASAEHTETRSGRRLDPAAEADAAAATGASANRPGAAADRDPTR